MQQSLATTSQPFAETKTENGRAYPKAAFAYTPDDVPSHWKLRLWDGDGPTAAQVGAAAAAFSPGGFRGQRVQIPQEDVAAVKARIRAAWKKVNPDKEESEMPDSIKASEEKKRTPGETFLSRLYTALKERMASGDFLSVDDFAAIFRSARGHAGGKVSRPRKEEPVPMAESPTTCPDCGGELEDGVCAECGYAVEASEGAIETQPGTITINASVGQNAATIAGEVIRQIERMTTERLPATPFLVGSPSATSIWTGDTGVLDLGAASASDNVARFSSPSDLADLAAQGHTHRLFSSNTFIDAPPWIPLLPRPGTFKHPSYGEIKVSAERNARFVANIKEAIYQHRLPIDAEHQTKLSGAMGWIVDAKQNSDGSVDGKVEWTDRGRALLKDNRFAYISPEWFDKWVQPETGQEHNDVLIGAALTSRPFFKNSALKPLVASEGVFIDVPEQGVDHMADEQQYTELQTKLTEQATALAAREAEIASLKQATEQAQQAADTAIKQANERVQALELARREDRFISMIASEHWVGDKAAHMQVLNALANSAGEDGEAFKSYLALSRSTAELAAKSALFQEVGTDGGAAPASPDAQIDALARKRMGETKEEYAAAYAAVLSENPQLYTEHRSARSA